MKWSEITEHLINKQRKFYVIYKQQRMYNKIRRFRQKLFVTLVLRHFEKFLITSRQKFSLLKLRLLYILYIYLQV